MFSLRLISPHIVISFLVVLSHRPVCSSDLPPRTTARVLSSEFCSPLALLALLSPRVYCRAREATVSGVASPACNFPLPQKERKGRLHPPPIHTRATAPHTTPTLLPPFPLCRVRHIDGTSAFTGAPPFSTQRTSEFFTLLFPPSVFSCCLRLHCELTHLLCIAFAFFLFCVDSALPPPPEITLSLFCVR